MISRTASAAAATMSPLLQRFAPLALAVSLGACGGSKEDASKSPLTAASSPASGVVQGPPTAPVQPATPPSPPVKVTALFLPTTTPTAVGSLTPMAVQATDAAGAAVPATSLTWESADPTLATVDPGGVVKPLRVGFTTIKASADGISASGTLSVRGTTAIPARSRYVGTNLSGIAYYSSQFPFADLMKSSGGWTSLEDNGTWNAAFPAMNADGYPAALKAGQHALNAVAWTGSHFAPGRYVVLWDGDGSISFPISNVNIAEIIGEPHSDRRRRHQRQPLGAIDRTSATNPVRNLRFLWPGTEVDLRQPALQSGLPGQDRAVLADTLHGLGRDQRVADRRVGRPRPCRRRDLGDARGVPIEMMIDLANTLHVDPWFCMPHQASDDYVRQFATLLRTAWTRAARTHRVFERGLEHRLRTGRLGQRAARRPSGWTARTASRRSSTRCARCRCSRSSRACSVRRAAAASCAYSPARRRGTTSSPTCSRTGHRGQRGRHGGGAVFQSRGRRRSCNVATTLTLSSDQIVDQMLVSIRGDIKSWMTTNAALAAKYKLKLKAYESGAGDSTSYFPTDKQDAMTALFISAHNNLRMKDVYAEYYGQWVASGGDTMNQYSDIGGWSKWGLWGSLQYVTQDPVTSPKYQGLLDFINAHPTR